MSKVVIEKSGGQVRLRGLKWPLPVTLDTEEKGRITATIKPNVWTKVSPEIYDFLERRFENPRYTAVPDVEANEASPHKPGEQPIMENVEVDRDYFLEFRR